MKKKRTAEDMSLIQFFQQVPDDATAERRFIAARCPRCNGRNVQEQAKHKTMPHRCRDCKRYFSVRTGTIMRDSKLSYQQWALAIFLMQTNRKGVSSVALAEKLGITQKSAWHLGHRIRRVWKIDGQLFNGTVEADETYMGGTDKNRHYDKKGTKAKTPVVGIKERESNRVHAVVMLNVNKFDVQHWLGRNVSAGARLFTDEAAVYVGADVAEHRSVNHRKKQYVSGDVYTNGVESHWALMKRGYDGTYHWWSVKHMQRYVTEFAGRFNLRDLPTAQQLGTMVQGMVGEYLPWRELVSDDLHSHQLWGRVEVGA